MSWELFFFIYASINQKEISKSAAVDQNRPLMKQKKLQKKLIYLLKCFTHQNSLSCTVCLIRLSLSAMEMVDHSVELQKDKITHNMNEKSPNPVSYKQLFL